MNIVNKITLSRVFIMPIFILGLSFEGIVPRLIAILCFIYASLSDWIDGYLARKNNMVTDFGKFIDPLADKIFVCAAFISFVDIQEINVPAWMIIIIISREFIITGLRTIAMSKGTVLPATKSGKFKTTSQLVFIAIILIILFVNDLNIPFSSKNLYLLQNTVPYFLALVVTILTFVSGASYLIKNRNLFSNN